MSVRHKIIIAFGVFLFAGLLNMALARDAKAGALVCFCHVPGGSPNTQCTAASGEQHGHLGHGDQPFGCECGDSVCTPELNGNPLETCGTCPTDCGACPTCGNGTQDEGEECGETGLSCPNGQPCVGCRCLPVCGNGSVEYGEQCDGTADCNPDCTFKSARRGKLGSKVSVRAGRRIKIPATIRTSVRIMMPAPMAHAQGALRFPVMTQMLAPKIPAIPSKAANMML
jgi:hypothetical protein